MNDESVKQLKAIKWILLYLTLLMSIVVFGIVGFIMYLNWEGKMSEEQEKSLQKIENLKGAPKPGAFTEDLPDVAPEIYDDQREGDEGFPDEIDSPDSAPPPDAEPEIDDDGGGEEDQPGGKGQ